MAQRWNDLLFAHWPVPAETLRSYLPPSLQLDTYEGQAWLGITPFWMSGVRPRGLPAFPPLSVFPELNVRTYAITEGKPGVFFFSLEAGNRLAVAGARLAYHLPYYHARMSVYRRGEEMSYTSKRTHRGAPPAEFVGQYRSTSEVYRSEPGSLEHWLTERYCLYAVASRNRLYRADISHVPWPLQTAEADITTNTMAASHGITLPDTKPLLHFSRKLDMVAWRPMRVKG